MSNTCIPLNHHFGQHFLVDTYHTIETRLLKQKTIQQTILITLTNCNIYVVGKHTVASL